MKRFLNIIIFLVLGIWSTYGQSGIGTDGYNPDNPGDPQVPEQKYSLTLGVTPNTAGSPNFTEKSCIQGERVYVYTNNKRYYVFEKWTEGDSVVSTSSGFNYIMPKRNVKLIAHYRYNPDSPADPDSIARKLNLTLQASPSQAGGFNFSNEQIEQGASCRLYAYADTHYDFEGWYEKGKLLSHDNPYEYVMGKCSTVIEGKFIYNPSNPSHPGSNFWNAETGMVIVDDFAPNEVISTIDDVIGGRNNRSNVSHVIVGGNMKSGDWGIANYFENCAIVDLKRTFGYTEVPDYAFDDCTNLQNIVLPACVEKINYRAFKGCSNLSEITCYAITPPALEPYALYGIAEGAILHVLSTSIPLYSEAEGWNKMTILPLQDEVRTLTVKLPEDCADGRYKNMWIELINQASGQRSKYVVSDRLLYTFNGLLEKETYSVVLRTPQGIELSRINDVLVKQDDLEVTFSEIKQLKGVNLTVMSPSGEDVTAMTKVLWLNEEGKYMKQGRSLNQLTSGSKVKYQVSFDRALGLVYQLPKEQEYLVQEDQNDIILTLDSLTKKSIFGVVKDKNIGTINHAVVTVSQKVNGEFMQSAIAKTNRQGKWNLTVYEAPATLTFSADDYVSKTFEVSAFGDSLDMGTCELNAITGAIIQVQLSYQSAQPESETSKQSEWYSDYANVGYRIYNETKQKVISAFNVQYPRIVLLEEVEAGDVLKVTAYSVKNTFSPVETTAVVDENNSAEAVINIVGLGAIQADFASSENANVSAILYNGQGELVEQIDYANGQVNFGDLSQGKYTLVSMAKSDLFNSISRLSQLQAAGLVKGSDFVQNELEVVDGLIQKVHNDVIPVLDESKLYYTGQHTSFSVNKSSITAGNYLTLASKIDFKDVYDAKVSDVKLVVDLPQNADFVDNSVMVGSELAQYALEGNRITVALGSYYYDKIRFCVIPTLGGEFRPSAFVEFTMDGKTVLQPIGSAFCQVTDLSINVPSLVAKNEIPVSGTAMAHSQVTIYDGNQVIGETKVLGNGLWNAVCQFDNPYNLSKHEVSALIKTKQGLELKSETKEIFYDVNAIEVSKVTMFNQSDRGQAITVFDFLNPAVSIPAYRYYPRYPTFTFLIDFTNNDTTKISNVELYVKTCKGNQVPLKANFDGNTKQWVAKGDFGDWGNYDIPANVSVDYINKHDDIVDRNQIDDNKKEFEDAVEINLQQKAIIDSTFKSEVFDSTTYNKLVELIELDMSDSILIDSLLLSIGINTSEGGDTLTSIEAENLYNECMLAWKKWESTSENKHKEYLDLFYFNDSVPQTYEYTFDGLDGTYSLFKTQLQDNDLKQLIDSTYQFYELTDKSKVYYKYTQTGFEYIDLKKKERFLCEQIKESIDRLNKFQTISNNSFLQDFKKKVKPIVNRMKNGWGEMDALAKCQLVLNDLEALRSYLDLIYNNILYKFQDVITYANKEIKQHDKSINTYKKIIEDYNKKISINYREQRGLRANIHTNQKIIEVYKRQMASIPVTSTDYKNMAAACKRLQNSIDEDSRQIEKLKAQVTRFLNTHRYFNKRLRKIEWNKSKYTKILSYLKEVPYEIKPWLRPNEFVRIGGKVMGVVGTLLNVWSTACDIYDAHIEIKEWYDLLKNVKEKYPCEKDFDNLVALDQHIQSDLNKLIAHTGLVIGAEVGSLAIDITELASPATAIWAWFGARACDIYAAWTKCIAINNYIGQRGDYYIEKGKLKCFEKDPDSDSDPNSDGGEHSSNNPDVDGIHDPAGYVYEAVHSNRVEGVTASCYYKEYVEDMYGDKHENIVLWNAEEYAQKNPLFTDENGMYRWDVPQGLWQVKFEKEGYQTTYSEWLPVPPPQLEVNVPISQLSQPSVENARAYEEGIEIQFDKYMDPATLDLEHVKVTKNNNCVVGKIILEDAEKSDKNSDLSYVSKIRFIPDSIFMGTDKVTLVVSRMVKSYAGIPMTEDYAQEFDIVREIKAIAVDSTYNVRYGKNRTITVSVLPADAAVGKKIIATSSAPLISNVTSEAILNENSQAQFVISGELPGTAMINFSMEDVSVNGQTLVNVVTKQVQPNIPTASRASGTEVFYNTTIELSSDVADAKIFYTLDGRCPCDSGALLYKQPIVIKKDVTIKAMVVDQEGNESNIAQFVYKIKRSNLNLDLAEGWSWISHNMENPLKVEMFEGKAERVQSQTGEAKNDPNYGFVGNLIELDATSAYKVEAKTASQLAVNDCQFNARDHHLTLKSGWNWMGYPMSQTMSVGEAFANASPTLGDLIVGLSGQAEYTAEGWKGSLKTLVPGQGYLYKAIHQMVFGFNTNIVSKAASLYAVISKKQMAPWVVNIHAYPNVMPMTVTLQRDNEELNDQSYHLGAFSGTECRGIGVYEDGHWYVTVHGEGDEEITFKAFHKDSEKTYGIQESISFKSDNVGTYEQPYCLKFGESTGIVDTEQGKLTVAPRVVDAYVTISLPDGLIDKISITSTNGKRVMVDVNCGSKTVLNVSDLSAGVYVVTVVSGDRFYYKKIIKK